MTKRILPLVLVLVVALCLAACGGGGGNTNTPSGGDSTTTPSGTTSPDTTPESSAPVNTPDLDDWPDNALTALIPKPNAGTFLVFTGSETNGLFAMTWTEDEMAAYIEQAKTAGFTENAADGDGGSYYGETGEATISIGPDGIVAATK